ncbi:MAG: peptidase MA family metallohydrolase, partial [Dehalococcoidia bacterium]|nr:peptidase MA family metallohydrolase [Dehalococcoidia bacterium]
MMGNVTSKTKWLCSVWLWLSVLIVLSLLLTAVPVAADTAISVGDVSVQSTFPQAMVFNIEARSPVTIKDVRLYYKVDRMNVADVVSEVWPRFSPATSVKTRYIWDMRKSSLPPSARLEYWWRLVNAAGDSLTTPKRVATFDDTRYSWKKIADDVLSLFWYSGDVSFAQALMSSAQDGLRRLYQDTGVRLTQPVKVFIYASTRDLQGAMIAPREWTGGSAYPEYGVVLLGISTGQLEWGAKAIVHELGHMVVNQLTFGPYEVTVPTWLNEGMAMYAEGGIDPAQEASLQRIVAAGKTISLRSLSSPFSALPAQAALSYVQSYSVVNFMIKNYGKEKLVELFLACLLYTS